MSIDLGHKFNSCLSYVAVWFGLVHLVK